MVRWFKKWAATMVTASGIAAIFVYVWACIACNVTYIILGFNWTWFSDLIDGPIARKFGSVSVFGNVFDFIRDRLLLFAFLFHAYYWNYLATLQDSGLAALIAFAELSIWGLRACVKRATGVFIRTKLAGKIRELGHVVTMLATIFFIAIQGSRGSITMNLAIMFTFSLVALYAYASEAKRLLVAPHIMKTPAAV